MEVSRINFRFCVYEIKNMMYNIIQICHLSKLCNELIEYGINMKIYAFIDT